MAWTKITRPRYERNGQRYASYMTDTEWDIGLSNLMSRNLNLM